MTPLTACERYRKEGGREGWRGCGSPFAKAHPLNARASVYSSENFFSSALRTFEKAIDTLTGRVAQAQASEQRVLDRAPRAEQQRDDATAAERIARDETAGLRAELDTRKQWGLWRRVRGR